MEHDDVDALLLEDYLVERRDQEGVLVGLRLVPHPAKVRSPALRRLFVATQSSTLSELRQADPALEITELWNLIIRGLLAENPI